MENNFYLGVIHYGKRYSRQERTETLVLYSDDKVNYLELESGIWYTTDSGNGDYVEKESIISTDISQYKVNYGYMLSRNKDKKPTRKKMIA